MKIGIWANTAKEAFWDMLPNLMAWLQEKEQSVFLTTRIHNLLKGKEDYDYSVIQSAEMFRELDLLLAMGGDGTILSAARAVEDRGTPILGVHLGGLGFLAEGGQENLNHRLESIMSGDYIIFPRMVLEVSINGGITYHALNDLVVDRGESFRLLKCSLSLNGNLITNYSADGLILATPTGSTAYNLSAGGPIVAPWLSLVTVTPICPHSFSSRPIVLPADQELTITFPHAEADFRLTVDGQAEAKLSKGTVLIVRRTDYDIQMVTFEDRDYFHTLRTKLGWGEE
ncbi:MAG: NAD(+)/NADH kinase [Fidelibacterota bacterium]